MDKNSYEEKIRALEAEIKIMKERYQILVETTSAILFEYKPAEDKMIFNYNFPENKSRREIDSYHEYMKHSPLFHPDHLKKFMDVLDTASQISIRGDLEYLSKVSSEEFEWHKTYYSSIADASGKIISVFGRICNIHKSATERQKIIHRVETLADTLIQMLPDKISGLERPLKCSIGISSRISRQDNFIDLFNRADSAMYQAKKMGSC